ncbi:MAG: hypothetical protein ABSC13_00690 [Dehalococcoidia bacterium]
MKNATRSLRSRLPRRLRCVLVALVLAALLLPSAVARAQTPPVAPGSVALDITCSPDTFRPNEWVVIECVTHIKNNGENAMPEGSVDVGSDSGVIPEYFWVSYSHSGRYWPVGTSDLSFAVPGLQPGGTFESKVTELSRMAEGTWQGSATLDIDGQSVATVALQQTASTDADALPDNLSITQTFSNMSADGTSGPTVTYETRITNRTSTPITNVKITERVDNAALLQTDPKPSDQNADSGLVSWDMTSFGGGLLIHGESLLLHTTYGPRADDSCASMSAGIVVEADVGGTTERYGVRPAPAPLGNCSFEEGVPGGRGGPVAFGQGGEGPAEATFDFIWAAAFLAAAGAGLVGLALVARRRIHR